MVDLTRVAVTRQLKAMASEMYEIGIFNRQTEMMLLRDWQADTIIKNIGFLKSKNITGHDIYIRPKGSVGLIFFDDLDRGTIARMKEDGCAPAVIIQSSPDNFHGWLRVSAESISTELATAVSKVLAKRYSGDENSADWRHFGRLAGFTNRKPEYIEAGKSPFVLLWEGSGKLAAVGFDLLAAGEEHLVVVEQERQKRMLAIEQNKGSSAHRSLRAPDDFYSSELRGIVKRFGGKNFDNSKADWMIINKMLGLGYPRGDIEGVLLDLSPAVGIRGKAGIRYIQVTLDRACGETAE